MNSIYFRKQVLNDIQQRLKELDAKPFNEENDDNHGRIFGIPDHCLQNAMTSLKAKRKNQSNVRTLIFLRTRCFEKYTFFEI